jgi:hypothetical protein
MEWSQACCERIMAKFAALKYTTPNIGDDFQTLAALQNLPSAARLFDRDRLDKVWSLRAYRTICNGWFMYRPDRWPPSRSIDPLITSVHLSQRITQWNRKQIPPRDCLLSGSNREYLMEQARRNGVGARDLNTLRALQEAGVPAYFSGCLTLTIRPPEGITRTEVVYEVDLPDEVSSALASRLRVPTTKLSHKIPIDMAEADRRKLLDQLHRTYATAALVITRRLHVALPCLAMGTPVLMIHKKPDDPRFDGLIQHVHFASESDFLAGRYSYDLSDPPPNRDTWRPLAQELANRCRKFVQES